MRRITCIQSRDRERIRKRIPRTPRGAISEGGALVSTVGFAVWRRNQRETAIDVARVCRAANSGLISHMHRFSFQTYLLVFRWHTINLCALDLYESSLLCTD